MRGVDHDALRLPASGRQRGEDTIEQFKREAGKVIESS
jgi:hypothetical protein